MEQKPHWLTDHEEDDRRRFDELKESITELKTMVKPISDTYTSLENLGRWAKLLIGFLALSAGLLYTIKQLWKI